MTGWPYVLSLKNTIGLYSRQRAMYSYSYIINVRTTTTTTTTAVVRIPRTVVVSFIPANIANRKSYANLSYLEFAQTHKYPQVQCTIIIPVRSTNMYWYLLFLEILCRHWYTSGTLSIIQYVLRVRYHTWYCTYY